MKGIVGLLYHLFRYVIMEVLIIAALIVVVAYTGLSWKLVRYVQSGEVIGGRSGYVLYGRRQWCLVWPETEKSRMAGDCDVSYGRRKGCLIWPETVMSRMAGDNCWLWYRLMALSCTCTLIYIGLVALWDRIHSSFSSITISTGYEPGYCYYLSISWSSLQSLSWSSKEPQESKTSSS